MKIKFTIEMNYIRSLDHETPLISEIPDLGVSNNVINEINDPRSMLNEAGRILNSNIKIS